MESKKSVIALLYLIIFHSSHGIVYYVKPDNTECPERVVRSRCWSLTDYIKNNASSDSRISEFQFLIGTHHLPGVFQMKNITQLSLTSYANHYISLTGSPVINIRCTKQASGLLFQYCTDIQIRDIQITDCTIHLTDSYAALVFDNFRTVSLINVLVENSTGEGVNFYSCHSQISIVNSSFQKNGGVNSYGGNARFTYDHCSLMATSILSIKSSNFTGSLTKDSPSSQASGITVISSSPRLNITLEGIRVLNNSDGNIKIAIENAVTSHWVITLIDSLIIGGTTTVGAGLTITTFDTHLPCFSCSCYNNNNILKVVNTNFTQNTAIHSGAGLNITLQETYCNTENITIINCRFEENIVHSIRGFGAAVSIIKHHFPSFCKHLNPSIMITLLETSFNQNAIRNKASVMELVNIEKVDLINCTFKNNEGSAIALKNTNLILTGNVVFENNTAENGAAIKFCDFSYMFLNENTHVIFSNNTARKTGGAIQVQDSCSSALPKPCFFQPIVSANITLLSCEYNMKIEFENNTAQVAGNAVYGGDIDYCYMFWTNLTSSNVFTLLFNFSRHDEDPVSSDAYTVHFCYSLDPQSKTVTTFPGYALNTSLITKGQHNGNVPAVIAVILPSRYDGVAEMHAVMDMHTDGTNCTNYSIIFTTETKMDIEVDFVVKQDISRYYSKNATLTVKFEDCPWGFDLVNGSCKCSAVLHGWGFICHINNLTIKKPFLNKKEVKWVGCYRNSNESCHGKRIIFTNKCGYADYCNSDIIYVQEDFIDRQCTDGRTGIACGSCKDNYSNVLGTNRCLRCSNNYIGLIAIYLLAGIVLIVLIMSFNITVSEGYLYGFIFYANVVHINQATFFPSFSNYDVTRIIIAWLNLDLGIEVCLYNGMTAYQKMWLQIGFVLYLFALQNIIIILCRQYVRWTRLFGRNATKVISTLFLLLFTKTGRFLSVASTATRLHIAVEDTLFAWQLNGDLRLGSSKHLPLFIFTTILGILVITLTFSLLFIQFLVRLSSIWCFKWVARLHPFFETFTGPCNPHFVFWPGLLFFLRLDLLVFYSIHHLQVLNMPATVSVCVFIAIISVVGPKGVYKQRSLNLLELVIILNLGVISIIASFPKVYTQIITQVSVCIAIASFLIFHLAVHFHKIQKFLILAEKAYCKFIKGPKQEDVLQRRNVTHSEVVVHGESIERSPFLTARAMPPVAQYDTFREPLIGSTNADED